MIVGPGSTARRTAAVVKVDGEMSWSGHIGSTEEWAQSFDHGSSGVRRWGDAMVVELAWFGSPSGLDGREQWCCGAADWASLGAQISLGGAALSLACG